MLIPNVRKIAVLRALRLGDLVFALPALQALHQAYPQAEITYLGRDWHTGFLPGRVPGIARVVALPLPVSPYTEQGCIVSPPDEPAVVAALRAEQFDLAVQLQGGGRRANPFIAQLGARVSIGARDQAAPPLDRTIPYVYRQSEFIRLLEVVGLASAPQTVYQPHLAVLPGDLAAAQSIFARLDRPFVVIHPGANDPRRCWDPLRFARVADACVEQFGYQVVLTGTGGEVDPVVAAMRAPAINACGQLSLAGMVGLLSQAALVISNDTGPLQLAVALGTHTVGLFWVEYVVNSLPLSRQRLFPLISWERACSLCGQTIQTEQLYESQDQFCRHETSFLNGITVEEVLTAVEQVSAWPAPANPQP